PAEHQAARGLHQALSLDDALAVVCELALAEEGLEHRCLVFLELQHERVVVVAADEERDPRPRADAADAYDLARGVHEPEPLEQMATVALETAAVGPDHTPHPFQHLLAADEIAERDDQRRGRDEARLAVGALGAVCAPGRAVP